MSAQAELLAAIDATWPPARMIRSGPWTLREGHGGGKRVSAATLEAPAASEAEIDAAETGMRALGQAPLFMLRGGDEALDDALAARGYRIVDPVTVCETPVARLTDVPIPRVTAFTIWEPLAIMEEIWAQGGIGPERLAVMDRAAEKTGILSRWNEKPAGVAFAARHGGIVMVHAVEVLPHQRRQGVAEWMMRAAAFWAAERGATRLAVLCTDANAPARALYDKLGFVPASRYHYRIRTEEETT